MASFFFEGTVERIEDDIKTDDHSSEFEVVSGKIVLLVLGVKMSVPLWQ